MTGDMADIDMTGWNKTRHGDHVFILTNVDKQEKRAAAEKRHQATLVERSNKRKELEAKVMAWREGVVIGFPPILTSNNLYNSPEGQNMSREKQNTFGSNSLEKIVDCSEKGVDDNVEGLQYELKDLEKKFRKVIETNTRLERDNYQLVVYLELLKDRVQEGEEETATVSKELRTRTRDFELLKKDHEDRLHAMQDLQAALSMQEQILQEKGCLEAYIHKRDRGMEQEKLTKDLLHSQEFGNGLSEDSSLTLNVQLKSLVEERDELKDTVTRLKDDLEDVRSKNNLTKKTSKHDMDRFLEKLVEDKLNYSKQIQILVGKVASLESQVMELQSAAETAKRAEENLKMERKKMQQELRQAIARNDELEMQNIAYIEARLDMIRTNKSYVPERHHMYNDVIHSDI